MSVWLWSQRPLPCVSGMHRCRCTRCPWWPHGSVTWGLPCSGLFSFTGSCWSAEELCACSPNALIHHLQFLKPTATWPQLTAAQPIRQLVEEEESNLIRSSDVCLQSQSDYQGGGDCYKQMSVSSGLRYKLQGVNVVTEKLTNPDPLLNGKGGNEH